MGDCAPTRVKSPVLVVGVACECHRTFARVAAGVMLVRPPRWVVAVNALVVIRVGAARGGGVASTSTRLQLAAFVVHVVTATLQPATAQAFIGVLALVRVLARRSGRRERRQRWRAWAGRTRARWRQAWAGRRWRRRRRRWRRRRRRRARAWRWQAWAGRARARRRWRRRRRRW